MNKILLLFLLFCGVVYADPIQDLATVLASVAPIQGVSIGDPNDKTTWRIDYQANATLTQQSAAQSIITTYDATLLQLANFNRANVRRALYTARGVLDAINEELNNDPGNAAIQGDQAAAVKVVVKLRIMAKQ